MFFFVADLRAELAENSLARPSSTVVVVVASRNLHRLHAVIRVALLTILVSFSFLTVPAGWWYTCLSYPSPSKVNSCFV
jgi:hypothetical protein